jgi:hypothetical protein
VKTVAQRNWDEKTLYKDHPVFGMGMSGRHRREWWNHKEDLDIEFYRHWLGVDSHILESEEGK